MPWLWWILWMIGAYLIGSIPFALLLGNVKGVDIRQVGSGNVGASNLGRTLGKKWGLGCFVLDVTKGLVPVLAFGLLSGGVAWLGDEPSLQMNAHHAARALVSPTSLTLQWLAVATAAILGHVYPIWIGFRGGKGVATSLGALVGIFPYLTLPAAAAFLLWFIVIMASGYVALASVVAATAMPLLALASGLWLGLPRWPMWGFVCFITLLSLLVILRHRTNIARICGGTERKAKWTGRANPKPLNESRADHDRD